MCENRSVSHPSSVSVQGHWHRWKIDSEKNVWKLRTQTQRDRESGSKRENRSDGQASYKSCVWKNIQLVRKIDSQTNVWVLRDTDTERHRVYRVCVCLFSVTHTRVWKVCVKRAVTVVRPWPRLSDTHPITLIVQSETVRCVCVETHQFLTVI